MSYRLEQQSDGTSRIAEITGAQGLTLPRYRRGWVSVDEKADVLDAVIADDGKSADVTVQYYASLSSLRIKKQGEVKNFCRSHPAGPRRIGLAQSSGKSTLPTKE